MKNLKTFCLADMQRFEKWVAEDYKLVRQA